MDRRLQVPDRERDRADEAVFSFDSLGCLTVAKDGLEMRLSPSEVAELRRWLTSIGLVAWRRGHG